MDDRDRNRFLHNNNIVNLIRNSFLHLDLDSFLLNVVHHNHFLYEVWLGFQHFDFFSVFDQDFLYKLDVLGLGFYDIVYIGVHDLSDGLDELLDYNLVDLRHSSCLVEHNVLSDYLGHLEDALDYLLYFNGFLLN